MHKTTIAVLALLSAGTCAAQSQSQADRSAMVGDYAPVADTAHTHRPYHPKRLILLSGVTVFEVLCARYDANMTEKGLQAGVAIEGNTWLLPNDHPTKGQLWRQSAVTTGMSVTPSLAAYEFRVPVQWFYAGLAGPVGLGLSHLRGGHAWARLLKQDGKQ
jgi:hypothetical protein